MLENFFVLLYNGFYYKQRFSVKDKIFFFRELAYLLQGGISIIEALNLIRDNSKNYCIREICDNIYSSLKKGETISRSISRLPKYFNDADVNILKSGENSGEFVRVLKYLGDEYEYLFSLRNKFFGAIFYPVILFLIAIGALFVVFKFVLPGIVEILFQFKGAELPMGARILVGMVSFFEEYFVHMGIIIFLAVFGFSIFLSVEEGRTWLDRKVFSFPVFGKVIKYYFLVKFLRYFKLFMSAGMGYVEMLYSLREIMSNRVYKKMISEMISNVRKGKGVFDTFQKYEVIIPQEVSVLSKVGEETSSMESSVDVSMSLYEEEFNNIIDNLSRIIEPLLLIVVGSIVAFIALSVFSIITSILDSLQTGM